MNSSEFILAEANSLKAAKADFYHLKTTVRLKVEVFNEYNGL